MNRNPYTDTWTNMEHDWDGIEEPVGEREREWERERTIDWK